MKPISQIGGETLKEIQSLMLSVVRRPLTPDEDMQPEWSDGRPTAEIAQTFIRPNDRMTAFDRLEVYNQQYWWRLTGCLQEDYRGLRAVIGDEAFDALLIAYLNDHPSRSWTLRNLGSHMPAFVESHRNLVEPHFELALDVARMEWARVVAYDDPEWPALDAEKLATAAAEGMRITVQPYVQLLTVSHPVDKFMVRLKTHDQQAASNSATHPNARKSKRRISVKPSAKPIHIAVHRLHLSLYYKRLDAEAMKLLEAVIAGKTLDEACSLAFASSKFSVKRQAAKVQEWFTNWMHLGWLCERPAAD